MNTGIILLCISWLIFIATASGAYNYIDATAVVPADIVFSYS